MDFKDKVVLITGASAGIGACCAINFAKLSAKLVLVGRNVENLKRVTVECENVSGTKPLPIIADISKEDDIKRIIENTIEHYGKIDVLVNNAGILQLAGIMDDVANYDRISATNVRGTYVLTQLAIPHLIKTKGNIVNISSVLSSVPMTILMPYCMTKAALDMFTKCVALELGPKGVRVNSVNPGPVATNIFKAGGAPEELNRDLYKSMAEGLPLRKVAQSEDVANIVIFLASDKASCVTGSFYMVDCGMNLGASPVRG